MMLINVITKLGLLSWPTIFIGMSKGWVSKEDAINYAVELMVSGCDDNNVVAIAGGDTMDEDELIKLITNQAKDVDSAVELDKWRLVHLLALSEMDLDEEAKIDCLQEVYAEFGYPEDMISCSIYAQTEIAPLEAMAQVLDGLKSRLTS